MRLVIPKLFLLVVPLLQTFHSCAQLCTGSLGDPVFTETFGSCTDLRSTCLGQPLPNGATNLTYSNDPCSEPGGSYGFITGMHGCHAGTWQILYGDHTGDPNGYSLIINGPANPANIFNETIKGNTLCPSTTYEFSAWVMNLCILNDTTASWPVPVLTFNIETAGGTILKSDTVADLPETVHPVWVHCGTFFTTPPDGSDIVIRLYDGQSNISNAPGGNDLAVDDITLRPCGPIINEGFSTLGDTTTRQLCVGFNSTYTLVAAQQGYSSPSYQWQKNLNDGNGWVDVPGATSTTLSVTLDNAAAGLYQYRLGVLSASDASLVCRIYSAPLNIRIHAPVLHLAPTTMVCEGQPLRFAIDQGDTYKWTGPNGVSSTAQFIVVDTAASTFDDGLYTVTVTTGGCSASASTMVNVFPKIIGAISNDTTICEGTSATLTAARSQGATNFTWTPPTGITDDDAATVSANPTKTTTYTVAMTNGGCYTVERSVTVTVLSKPIANAGPNKTIMEGDAVKLDGAISGDSVRYHWTPPDHLNNPDLLTPAASPVDNTIYTLHATTNDNCGEDTSNVFVRVYKKITIPNTFTPNHDGVNDYWDIKNLGTYPGSSILVFNRWGQQVYQSIDYPKPWDGTYNGSPLPAGTYYYVIDLKNDMPKLAGWVLIVR